MLTHNKKMQEFLAHHGIKAVPKYFFNGSMKGTWRIYGKDQDWYNNNNLRDKMIEIGFVDFDNEPLRKFSGNGGTFQVFVRHPLTAGLFKNICEYWKAKDIPIAWRVIGCRPDKTYQAESALRLKQCPFCHKKVSVK